jgi:membrane fusion protein (multidrug efflux system)
MYSGNQGMTMKTMGKNWMDLTLATALLAFAVTFVGCAGGNSNAAEGPAGQAEGDDAKGKDGEPAQPQAAPVEVATLARGSMEAILRYSTDLEAEQAVPVYSQSPQLRRVTQLLVEEGQRVGRGQLLAKLQDDEQRHGMERVQGRLGKAKADLERQERLFAQNLVSEQTVIEMRHAYEQLEIELADVRQAWEHTEVRAPISGTVTVRNVKLGDSVTGDLTLFEIVDFDTLVARVYVPERELGRVRPGQPARIATQALPGVPFAGVVDRVAPVVDPKSGTVKVTIRVPPADGLRPGMFLDVQLVTDVRADALLLPKRALLLDHDQAWVYRLKADDTVERLLVQPVLEDAANVEIRDGLAAGDRVVVAGQAGLKPGAKVRVVQGQQAIAQQGASHAD